MPLPEILSSAPDHPSTHACTPNRPSRVIFSRVAKTAPTPTASCFHQGLSVSAVYSAVVDPALFSSIIVQQMTCDSLEICGFRRYRRLFGARGELLSKSGDDALSINLHDIQQFCRFDLVTSAREVFA
jgi:hypothetical protein